MKIAAIALPALLLATPATAVVAQAASPGSAAPLNRGEIEEFFDLYIEVYNSHDMSRLDEIVTPDSINENPLGTMTVPELAAVMTEFYAAFPDLHYEIEDVLIDGEQVVLEYSYTGTHLGPVFGMPATGTVVHGRGLEVHEMEDGLIKHTRNYSDVFGLFVQLGAI